MINTSLKIVMQDLGLTDKHGLVYGLLMKMTNATPLQLARETKINRSSLYRYLDELREVGLVELILKDKSRSYKANPDGLSQYLVSEEARVEKLKARIPKLIQELGEQKAFAGSEVKYFQGREGLKQMLWNVVASGQEYMGLGYENWNTSVGKTYADKLRSKNMETGVKSREITNDQDGGFEFTSLGKKYQQVYTHRRIDPHILTIKHDTYIYRGVFAYYYHYQGEYFGVEIHNKEIASTERQVFEILWKLAKYK